MPIRRVAVAPEYLGFYIAGTDAVRVPLDHERVGIVASEQCINVGCLYWNEGDTTITLGRFAELPTPARPPKFDGILDTPEHRVVLFDANIPEILAMTVPDVRTRVRIWTNHKTEPDDVIIALG
ncbi:MAG: hypothetical protein V7704_08245 [Aurantimonas endophytica]|uniref:hypothetical protein n=1 Tax=Aurantimonas endophytica TaxID=1522175 RepID=UPI0030037613